MLRRASALVCAIATSACAQQTCPSGVDAVAYADEAITQLTTFLPSTRLPEGFRAPVDWPVMELCSSNLRRVSDYVSEGGRGVFYRCTVEGMIGEFLVFVPTDRSSDFGCSLNSFVFFDPDVDPGVGRALLRLEQLER